MNSMIHEMSALITKNQSFVLAMVISSKGSTPRSAGAKLLVRKDGSTLGTVGGGSLEAKVEELAMQVLQTHQTIVKGFEFTGKDATDMESICGGQVDILIEWIDSSDPATIAVIREMEATFDNHRKAWLITSLPLEDTKTSHALVFPDGNISGLLPEGLNPRLIIHSCSRSPHLVHFGKTRSMIEPLGMDGTVFIFGAGHVARSLAEFTNAVGFWTVVLDDRSEFVNLERFPKADELMVLESFSNAFSKLQIDTESYIAIVTRGHLNDRIVLTQALKTPAGYIGMIGSRRKCALIFEELIKEGFTPEDIHRVHAPIGLPIDSETPDEIGISIVAELIKVRAGLN